MSDPENEIVVSAVTAWEFAIKRSVGKLTGRDDLLPAVRAQGFHWLPVSPEHAWHVSGLPLHHRDPFDRLLVAQAQLEGLAVVTRDPQIAAYDVRVAW
jgi:PIN domain nuclease of toxin-antitoxin system